MRYLSALTLITLFSCAKPAPPAQPEEPVTITIVAMNDFHGAIHAQTPRGQEDMRMGGLPWLVGAVDAIRTEHPDMVLLDGGDVFQGDWEVNATEGRGAVDALNMLGLDAAAVGNHDFDYGPLEDGDPDNLRGALEAGAKRSNFQWLSANIENSDGSVWAPDGIAPWTIIERKGKRIGVIGLSTQDTPQTTLLRNVADLSFTDIVETVRELLPVIHAEGVDAMVLVAHLTGSCEPEGYFQVGAPCTPDDEIGCLLNELPVGTFDVMVLGHAHTIMAHRVGDTFLMEQRAKGHALGTLELVFGPDGVDADASHIREPWPLLHTKADPGCEEGEYDYTPQQIGERTVTPNAEAVALVDALEAEAGSMCEQLGCADHYMGRTRTAESEAGNFMADAMLGHFPQADFAIQNSGGVRANLPEGVVRRGSLQAMMPFDNRVFLVEMTGVQVNELFRLGSSGAHGILQVAGATYHFDPEQSGGSDLDGDGETADWETNRLCAVTVGQTPVDPEATYKIVTTDFLFDGGDHLGHVFEHTTLLEEGPLLREVLYSETSALGDVCIGANGPLVNPEAPRIAQGSCN